jgi:hypothetical protein
MDWEYSPAPESSSIADIRDRYLPFIDGAFREGSGEDRDTINPGTGEGLSTVSTVTGADIDRAVKSARRAYEEVWSSMPGAERGKYLLRIARVIAERSRELAVVETLDNGKPIKETRDFDVPAAAEHFFYHAGWADKLQHLGLGPAPQPLDVAGQVIPWNLWRCPSGSGRPRFDDVGLGGGDYRNCPHDDVFGDSGLPHSGHQMSGDRGEVIMADSEAGVGLVKRASVVVCRAAEHLRYQEHLVAPKSRKIDPFEVRCKLRIAQNALIKIVHDSAYGGSAADDVVVTQAPASRLVTHACSSFRVADVANKFTFTCHV